MANILLTGHRGYIGANVADLLADSEHDVYGYDLGLFCPNDNATAHLLNQVDSIHEIPVPIDIVIHLGARISVEESVHRPRLYWKDNVESTLELLRVHPNAHFIFASTSQVGIGDNPYTRTKEAMEMAIKDMAKSYHIFRFYNVAGAGEYGQIGPSTHLIRIASEVALKRRTIMNVFGDDYDTPDGTCVRDFIHVCDLAKALVTACDYAGVKETVNLGSGEGYSVKDVIETMRVVAKRFREAKPNFTIGYTARRPGDPPSLICKPDELTHKYFQPVHNLEDMCYSALKWELR